MRSPLPPVPSFPTDSLAVARNRIASQCRVGSCSIESIASCLENSDRLFPFSFEQDWAAIVPIPPWGLPAPFLLPSIALFFCPAAQSAHNPEREQKRSRVNEEDHLEEWNEPGEE